MKIIIDMSYNEYHEIKCEGIRSVRQRELLWRAIENGIPYEERPQGDLISRSDLNQAINKIVDEEIGIDEKWAKGLKYSLKVIDNAPAIPVDTCINYKVCTLRKQEELIPAIEDCED